MSHKNTVTVKAEVDTMDCQGSSNVLAAEYFLDSGNPNTPELHTMAITFKSGKYTYYNYPQSEWDAFKAEPSKGAFVNTRIVGPDRKNPIYKGVRVGD